MYEILSPEDVEKFILHKGAVLTPAHDKKSTELVCSPFVVLFDFPRIPYLFP